MTLPSDPQHSSPDERFAGEPLVDALDMSASVVAPFERVDPQQTEPVPEPFATRTSAQQGDQPRPDAEEAEQGGGKAKAAALVAGAAAVANKMRHEVPRKVRQLREKRVAGRCVILTEADGHFLAIGPYQNEEAARQDIFKVGGTPHVAELVSEAAFFEAPAP